jgi:hypothetical protein
MVEELLHCVFSDDVFQLDQLIQTGADPNSQVVMDSPPPVLAFTPSLLAIAAFHGSFQVFKLLMRRTATPKLTDSRRTSLECFIAAGGNLQIFKSFLQSSSFQSPPQPKNALHFAAEYGRVKIVKLLLERNYCSPNCVDIDGVCFKPT